LSVEAISDEFGGHLRFINGNQVVARRASGLQPKIGAAAPFSPCRIGSKQRLFTVVGVLLGVWRGMRAVRWQCVPNNR
jgi:hypothetical protein